MPNLKEHEHNSTPASVKSSKAQSSNAWVKSAAKRVGLRRAGDGTPRSRKEGLLEQSKGISFPDKVCLYNLILNQAFDVP